MYKFNEKECGEKLLRSSKLIDIYESEQLGENKSVTIRMTFVSNEHNLSIEDVQKHVDVLLEKLAAADITLKK